MQRSLAKLRWLASVDARRQAFGAHEHHYRPGRPLTPAELEEFEARHGVVLPDDLRRWFTEAGAAGAGPGYGLYDLHDEYVWRHVDRPFPGLDALRRSAAKQDLALYDASVTHALVPVVGDEWIGRYYNDEFTWSFLEPHVDAVLAEMGRVPEPVTPGTYFEAPLDEISGVVRLTILGCGHTDGVEVTGPTPGRVWSIGNDGMVAGGPASFAELYEGWLDELITDFVTVAELMRDATTTDELDEAFTMRRRQTWRGVLDLMVSILDVEKPPALFGPGGRGTHDGASQFPWYEATFQDWRRTWGAGDVRSDEA